MSDAGVIGYDPRNNCKPALSAAAKNPRAVAWLPVIFLYVPAGSFADVTL